MAVMYIMEFSGVGQEQYDGTIRDLDLENRPADGGLIHVAGPVEGGWRVVDVWESQEHFDTFLRDRLGAALGKNGVPAPTLTVVPVHAMIGQPQAPAIS